jgi:hypothetical protein
MFTFYRFGFRLSDNFDIEGEGLEERAEKLRKHAQDQHESVVEVAVSLHSLIFCMRKQISEKNFSFQGLSELFRR